MQFYASFAPKRHAVEVARREATKRGFPPGTKRTVQVLTDGDNDLALYIGEIFPDALHTIDVMHVIEKLWDAGSSVHREGTPECHAWVERQKDALYAGNAVEIVAELDGLLARIARSGPGNKFRREKLAEIRTYIDKRKRGMKERAESVLQLRCIDANGSWDAFVAHVAASARDVANMTGARVRLQQRAPNELPKLAIAA